jgi:hypothetical protein
LGELPLSQDFIPDFAFGHGGIFSVFTGTGCEVFVVGEKSGIKPLPTSPCQGRSF